MGFFWLVYLVFFFEIYFLFMWNLLSTLPAVPFFLYLFSSAMSFLLSLGHGAETAASVVLSVLYTVLRHSDILCCLFPTDFYSFEPLFLLICAARASAHFVALHFISFSLKLYMYFEEQKLKDTFTDNTF